jgi:hypothetical protein
MVHHEVQEDFDASVVAALDQRLDVFEGSVRAVYVSVV